jgi:uroporphyrin-III C-methyltransferase
VREAARRIGARGGFALVEAAFLEIERPDIAAGFARLVERGARHIIVHPYFLSPGRHTRGDLPREVSAAAKDHPGVSYQITEPLSAHPLVIAASVERIRETAAGWARDGIESEESRETSPETKRRDARRGTVYLVGAGPGDPGLLTIKARDLLATCDVAVYDYLVNPEILRHAPSRAERIYVGKVGGGRQTEQAEINRLLVKFARSGARVVRLKGGDPFLYGRGGEEAEALVAAGIPFEVVPGVSSALAAPAYAGIPLTHRKLAASVAFMTGTRAEEQDGETQAFAAHATADTLVVLMGVSRLRRIASDLIAGGRSPETPVAVVRWGTYEGQQTVTGPLRDIGEVAERAGMRAPAVIVVGEVVRLRERLQWFERSVKNGAAERELESVVERELELAAVAGW